MHNTQTEKFHPYILSIRWQLILRPSTHPWSPVGPPSSSPARPATLLAGVRCPLWQCSDMPILHNTTVLGLYPCWWRVIVAFPSFLVWFGCGSSIASKHSACAISLNLGDHSNSALWDDCCSKTRSRVWLKGRFRIKGNWCSKKIPHTGDTNSLDRCG